MKIWKMGKKANDFANFFLKHEEKVDFIEEKLSRGNLINEWEELIGQDLDKPIGDTSHIWIKGNHFLFSERAKEVVNKNFGKNPNSLNLRGGAVIFYILSNSSFV